MNLPLKQEAIPYDHNNDLEIFKQNSVLIQFERLTRFSSRFVKSIYNDSGVKSNKNTLSTIHKL